MDAEAGVCCGICSIRFLHTYTHITCTQQQQQKKRDRRAHRGEAEGARGVVEDDRLQLPHAAPHQVRCQRGVQRPVGGPSSSMTMVAVAVAIMGAVLEGRGLRGAERAGEVPAVGEDLPGAAPDEGVERGGAVQELWAGRGE